MIKAKNYISKYRNPLSFGIEVYKKYRNDQKWAVDDKKNENTIYIGIMFCIYNIILDTKESILYYKKLSKKYKLQRNTLYVQL